jgi:hypothetical protein
MDGAPVRDGWGTGLGLCGQDGSSRMGGADTLGILRFAQDDGA